MKTFEYTVRVEAESQDEANTVMTERIYFEEDYGFPYAVHVIDEDGKPWGTS